MLLLQPQPNCSKTAHPPYPLNPRQAAPFQQIQLRTRRAFSLNQYPCPQTRTSPPGDG